MVAMTTVAMAQENGNRDANNKIVRGPYETNKFFDNWFIGVAGGVNQYHGEYDYAGTLGENLGTAIDVSLGKWITPSTGVRLQWTGIQARGLSPYLSPYATGSTNSDGAYKEKFNLWNLHGDFLWNISNAIGGYKETRTWSFVPFMGIGLARSGKNGICQNEVAATVGLLNIIRLGNRVDLTLEARQMFVNERLDKVVGGKKSESMTSLTAGISFKLGKTNFKRVVAPDYTSYNNRIKALEAEKDQLNGRNKQLADELDACKNKPAAAPVVVEKASSSVKASPVALFFGLGKATLDKKELANLEFYVKTAMEVDKDKTFTLTGSADKATGNAAINQRLSEQRMQYVYDILVTKYGVNPSRLVKKAAGDTNNRFEEPELNRAVFIE